MDNREEIIKKILNMDIPNQRQRETLQMHMSTLAAQYMADYIEGLISKTEERVAKDILKEYKNTLEMLAKRHKAKSIKDIQDNYAFDYLKICENACNKYIKEQPCQHIES
jgi:predicted Ser/Thr protein kinase